MSMATTKAHHNQSSWDSFQQFGKIDYMKLPRISKDNLPSQDMLASRHAPTTLKSYAAQQLNKTKQNKQQLIPENKTWFTKENKPESIRVVSEAVTPNTNLNQNTIRQLPVNTPEEKDSDKMAERTRDIALKMNKSG